MQQAKRAGIALKNAGFKFDLAYTSLLTRAQKTLAIILEQLGQQDIPQFRTWRLNERHYGEMNGFNKDQIVEKFGDRMVGTTKMKISLSSQRICHAMLQRNSATYIV